MPRFPARVHILLAQDAPLGLVIRRGPAKSVCTILWNRKTDEFTLGQWMRGRVYERRSDLSPDGRHMIYFAMNGKWESETKGAWTAISRTPYLKAVTLYAKGDCWNGGGLFTGNRNYWLNDGTGHTVLHDSTEVRRQSFNPLAGYRGECPGVYFLRLERDGWTMGPTTRVGSWHDVTVFEKAVKGGWVLKKLAHSEVGAPPGKGCYWDEHELIHPEKGILIEAKDWEWADIDRKRLVWAAAGKLHTGYLRNGGIHDERVLHDFNGMTFEAISAPY